MDRSELLEFISYVASQTLDCTIDEGVVDAAVLNALVSHYRSHKNLTNFGNVEKMLFDTPFEEMPLYVQHSEIVLRLIAKWRLETGT